MGKKRVYTITEVNREPSLFQTAVPFDITVHGEVVATVISPKAGTWRECEKCGENTQNIIEFQDKELRWQKIILCDKCANELL
jgi:hypothetical protein